MSDRHLATPPEAASGEVSNRSTPVSAAGPPHALHDEIARALVSIDSEVAQMFQHTVDEAARLAALECARWLRRRCSHADDRWGTYSDTSKCHYPQCAAAREIEEATDA